VSRFGSSIGNSKGHFMIASGLLPGALGGTRTPNLLIRSKIRTSNAIHECRFDLVAGYVVGKLLKPHPSGSRSVVSKSVSTIRWPREVLTLGLAPIRQVRWVLFQARSMG
jgi:hypothetical protein